MTEISERHQIAVQLTANQNHAEKPEGHLMIEHMDRSNLDRFRIRFSSGRRGRVPAGMNFSGLTLLLVLSLVFHHQAAAQAKRLTGSIVIKAADHQPTEDSEPAPSKLERHKSTLKTFGIEPTDAGVRRYLESYKPSADTKAMTKKWVKALQDPSYAIREKATQQLVLMPVIQIEFLKQLTNDEDLEVAYRAREIFSAREKQVKRLQAAVFGYLSESRPEGLMPVILSMLDQVTDSQVLRSAHRAIEATAGKADQEVLRRLVDDHANNEELAKAGLRALRRLDQKQATQWILSRRNDLKLNKFKLFCAEVLAFNKHKECLDFYVDLLGAEDLRCRSRAFGALRGMIDKRFEYSVSQTGASQTTAIQKWREYITDNKTEIEIAYRRSSAKLGRLLVASYSSGKIDSYDETGKLKWTAKGSNPFTCQGLPNGNVIVMFYSVGKLMEYDETGKVVKEFTNMPKSASGIQRLENGHTILSAGQGGNKIVEIDKKGKQVWSVVVTGTPTSSRLQENGLFLTALFGQSKLVEIDRKGKVVNEIPVKGKPYTAHRLEYGNILVAFASGGVAEYSQDGEELWRAKTDSNTYWADILNDDTIVVADKTGILKFTREGKLISRDDRYKNYTYISAY